MAARRLYQGILDITWCGTCTLMSKHRNSTHCAAGGPATCERASRVGTGSAAPSVRANAAPPGGTASTHPGVVAVHGARELCLGCVPLSRGLEGDVRRGVVHHGEGACNENKHTTAGMMSAEMPAGACVCTSHKQASRFLHSLSSWDKLDSRPQHAPCPSTWTRGCPATHSSRSGSPARA